MTVTLERVPLPPLPLSPEEPRAHGQRHLRIYREVKRPWPLRHPIVLGLMILAIIALSIAIPLAVNNGKANTLKAPVVAVGQPLVITGNGGLRANVTVRSVTQSTHPYGTTNSEPPANGAYAVADISISVKAGSYRFEPLYFIYQSADGRTYRAFGGNAWSATYSSAGTLSSGQSNRYYVTFDVASPGRDIQVTDPLGTVVGRWNLSSVAQGGLNYNPNLPGQYEGPYLHGAG